MNIRDTLELSIVARNGVDAGHTWADFQIAMERLGVRAETPLASIEYGVSRFGRGVIRRDDDERGRVEIREGS